MMPMREATSAMASGANTIRPPYRANIALLGIYEISKALCGPGSLQDVMTSTLYVLHSFLDMGNGTITMLDEEGAAEMVFSATLEPSKARA